jgi:hypothetical protein
MTRVFPARSPSRWFKGEDSIAMTAIKKKKA